MDAAFTPVGGRGILVPATAAAPTCALRPARCVPPAASRPLRLSVRSLLRFLVPQAHLIDAVSIVPMVRMRAVIPRRNTMHAAAKRSGWKGASGWIWCTIVPQIHPKPESTTVISQMLALVSE